MYQEFPSTSLDGCTTLPVNLCDRSLKVNLTHRGDCHRQGHNQQFAVFLQYRQNSFWTAKNTENGMHALPSEAMEVF